MPTLTILLNNELPPDFRAEIAAAVPQVVFLRAEDIAEDPSLLAQVEIVYGGLEREQWAHAPRLCWVQTTWAGVEGLLTPEAQAHPARITNAHIHAEPIAEHLFAMLLALVRALPTAWAQQQDQRWDSGPLRHQVRSLQGSTLGLLGLGAIGQRAAAIGHAFGMRVIGLRRRTGAVPGVAQVFTESQKEEMLAQCDVLMNTLPLTPHTLHFIGAAELTVMPRHLLLLNVGRGGTIDTTALVDALQTGEIAGAALDVTDPEPLPPDHPLWRLPQVLITPHYAGQHPDNPRRAAQLFLDNLRRYLADEPLCNVVDKASGY
ncbi:MAG TPA: D-2-hydroxyacid dehydrogenase [Armatimonadota bacterium]|jgi:phosphoglycerate dehydrogenase-like enzyme